MNIVGLAMICITIYGIVEEICDCIKYKKDKK